MTVDEIRHLLQQGIADQAVVEGTAAIWAGQLSKSQLLLSEERDFAGDVLRKDEAAHLIWTRSAFEILGRTSGTELRQFVTGQLRKAKRMALRHESRSQDIDHLTRIHFDERYFLRQFGSYGAILRRILPDELSAGWTQLREDELRHTKWSKIVLQRLSVANPEWRSAIKQQRTIRGAPVERLARRFHEVYHRLARI